MPPELLKLEIKMKTMNNKNIGKYFTLETKDFHGDHAGFLKAIKKLRTVTPRPAELDDDGFWWYCGNVDWPAVQELYKKHIGDILRIIESDKKAGFEPLKRGWKR